MTLTEAEPVTHRRAVRRRVPASVVSLVVGIAVWWLLAGRALPYLPPPGEVADEFFQLVGSGDLYEEMRITLRRIVTAWVIGLCIAITIGVLMARNAIVEVLAHPLVFVGLAVPGPVAILFSVLVFGLGESTALIALCAVVTPFMITFVYDGSRALDESLFSMADAYGFGAVARLRHVILPQLAPSLFAAARFGFAMTWKIVVLVEALAAGDGIGERIEYAFSFNRPDEVIAWTLCFTVVMVLVEVLAFRTASAHVFRWRNPAFTSEGRT